MCGTLRVRRKVGRIASAGLRRDGVSVRESSHQNGAAVVKLLEKGILEPRCLHTGKVAWNLERRAF